MNAGIFLGRVREDAGGGFTFVQSMLSALETAGTTHRFFVFYYGKEGLAASSGEITYVPLSHHRRPRWLLEKAVASITGKRRSMLQIAADYYRIDLIWFVSTDYSPVDIPYLCTVFDLEHRRHPFFPEVGDPDYWAATDRRYRTMIPRAAYVISGTEAGKRQIVDFYRAEGERVRVIPFPVAPFALREEAQRVNRWEPPAGHPPYLFYPAQFWPHKNHVTLLNALKLLKSTYALDIDLVLCGADKGNLAHVKETSRELGLEGKVRYLGFVPQAELYPLYRNAFALVYPSLFGPDNLPPLEAFAIGCPVIAAGVAGAVEQFGDAALLINPLSAEEIAQAVVHLHENREARLTFIEKGRERSRHCSAQKYLAQILALYDEFEQYRRCWSRKGDYRPS